MTCSAQPYAQSNCGGVSPYELTDLRSKRTKFAACVFNLYDKSQPEHQTKRGEIDSFRTISSRYFRRFEYCEKHNVSPDGFESFEMNCEKLSFHILSLNVLLRIKREFPDWFVFPKTKMMHIKRLFIKKGQMF